MPRTQKIIILFLVFLALLIVVFGIWQLKQRINAPFAYPESNTNSQNNFKYSPDNNSSSNSSSTLSNASIELLKKTDTDGDGLSDYDELYIYHTSPYLVDTDGDGISDFQEIKDGTDPNCPQGKVCHGETSVTGSNSNSNTGSGSNISSSSSFSAPASSLGNLNSNNTTINSGTTGSEQNVLQQLLHGQVTATKLRQILVSTGVSTKQELDKISDEDLMKSYQATLNSQNSSTSTVSK